SDTQILVGCCCCSAGYWDDYPALEAAHYAVSAILILLCFLGLVQVVIKYYSWRPLPLETDPGHTQAVLDRYHGRCSNAHSQDHMHGGPCVSVLHLRVRACRMSIGRCMVAGCDL